MDLYLNEVDKIQKIEKKPIGFHCYVNQRIFGEMSAEKLRQIASDALICEEMFNNLYGEIYEAPGIES